MKRSTMIRIIAKEMTRALKEYEDQDPLALANNILYVIEEAGMHCHILENPEDKDSFYKAGWEEDE